jgi:hypothetical protein
MNICIFIHLIRWDNDQPRRSLKNVRKTDLCVCVYVLCVHAWTVEIKGVCSDVVYMDIAEGIDEYCFPEMEIVLIICLIYTANFLMCLLSAQK